MKFSNIVHIGGNQLQLPPNVHGINGRISLIIQGEHSYKPIQRITNIRDNMFDGTVTHLCANSTYTIDANTSWRDKKRIIDRVHKQVCGHSN